MILKNCRIFDGNSFIKDTAVLTENDKIVKILTESELSDYNSEEILDLNNAVLSPGFIDLQLNGCGGVLFNDDISRKTLEIMNETNQKYGCTSFLPTLITSPDEKIIKSLELIDNMTDMENIGVLGLHIEGPNISLEKKGIHNPAYIRILSDDIVDRIASSGSKTVKIITMAPEKAQPEHLEKFKNAKIHISMGHTFAKYAECEAKKNYFKNATHLFNAMTEFGSREPGVVGHIFDKKDIYAGIIADGFHCDFASLRVAHSILQDKLYLVTDAVSPAGTDMKEFIFEGKRVFHENGKCFGEDGTLGGSALVMNAGVRNLVQHVGLPVEEALRMATSYPAKAISVEDRYGYIKPGYIADFAVLNDNFDVLGIVAKGKYKKFN
jgi:N-acetylglucosamine-6-phosphate deacetylase